MHKTRKSLAVWLAFALLLLSAGPPGVVSVAARASAAGTPTETAEEIPFYLSGSEIVYVTATGRCYHSVPDCRNTKTAYALSLEEACRMGYAPCSWCDPPPPVKTEAAAAFPEGSVIVYVTVGGECYHRTADCGGMKDAVPVTLQEALYLGRRPCKKCRPPQE